MDPYADHPVVIFDGFCNLCSRSVQFILKKDKREIFRFLPFQSGTTALFKVKYSHDLQIPESVILIDKNKVYTRSEAILRIFRKLNFPLNLIWGFIIIPRPVRDLVYLWIAKKRFNWFGTRKSCFMPEEKWKHRFI